MHTACAMSTEESNAQRLSIAKYAGWGQCDSRHQYSVAVPVKDSISIIRDIFSSFLPFLSSALTHRMKPIMATMAHTIAPSTGTELGEDKGRNQSIRIIDHSL